MATNANRGALRALSLTMTAALLSAALVAPLAAAAPGETATLPRLVPGIAGERCVTLDAPVRAAESVTACGDPSDPLRPWHICIGKWNSEKKECKGLYIGTE